MKLEQFEVLLEFHLGLIRAEIKPTTTIGARKKLVDGIFSADNSTIKREVENLVNKLNSRFVSLQGWVKSKSINEKIKLYNSNNNRNPSDDVFYATFKWMVNPDERGLMYQTSIEHGINPQCMKALKPRIERWDSYAIKLIDTL